VAAGRQLERLFDLTHSGLNAQAGSVRPRALWLGEDTNGMMTTRIEPG
jgi:hypothetical protein